MKKMQRSVTAHKKLALTYVEAHSSCGAVEGEELCRETPWSCGKKGVIILSWSITVIMETHTHTHSV